MSIFLAVLEINCFETFKPIIEIYINKLIVYVIIDYNRLACKLKYHISNMDETCIIYGGTETVIYRVWNFLSTTPLCCGVYIGGN